MSIRTILAGKCTYQTVVIDVHSIFLLKRQRRLQQVLREQYDGELPVVSNSLMFTIKRH